MNLRLLVTTTAVGAILCSFGGSIGLADQSHAHHHSSAKHTRPHPKSTPQTTNTAAIETCKRGLALFFSAQSSIDDDYNAFSSSAHNTDLSYTQSRNSSDMAATLSYVSTELELAHALARTTPDRLRPGLDLIAESGIAKAQNATAEFVDTVRQRNAEAVTASQYRYDFAQLYYTRGMTSPYDEVPLQRSNDLTGQIDAAENYLRGALLCDPHASK